MVHLTVCSYDVNVTYACQSESTLYSLDLAPVLSKEFLDIQATIERGFILKGITWNDKNTQSNALYG